MQHELHRLLELADSAKGDEEWDKCDELELTTVNLCLRVYEWSGFALNAPDFELFPPPSVRMPATAPSA